MKAALSLAALLIATANVHAADRGEAIYRQHCAACHDTGAAGAPRIGDRRAWAPRIREGRRMMVKTAIKGIRGMPARGGNPALSDDDVEHAVVHLLNRSGAKFKP